MHRHTFDPVSASLALAAGGVGVVVATGHADPIVDNAVWWGALIAIPLGLALVPWSRFSRAREEHTTSQTEQDIAPDAVARSRSESPSDQT